MITSFIGRFGRDCNTRLKQASTRATVKSLTWLMGACYNRDRAPTRALKRPRGNPTGAMRSPHDMPLPRSPHALKNNQGLLGRVREFLYGMLGYEFSHHALEERGALETLFILIT